MAADNLGTQGVRSPDHQCPCMVLIDLGLQENSCPSTRSVNNYTRYECLKDPYTNGGKIQYSTMVLVLSTCTTNQEDFPTPGHHSTRQHETSMKTGMKLQQIKYWYLYTDNCHLNCSTCNVANQAITPYQHTHPLHLLFKTLVTLNSFYTVQKYICTLSFHNRWCT